MMINGKKISDAMKNFLIENEIRDEEFQKKANISDTAFKNVMHGRKIQYMTGVKICKAIGISDVAGFLGV